MRNAASTGMTVSDSSSAAASANPIVSATGLNRRPSSPCSDSSGMNTVMMMTTPATSGTTTSFTASSVMRSRAFRSGFVFSAMRCSTFSTTTTAQSTRSPMAMARPPNDIIFADQPNSRMMMNVERTASGRHAATTTAALRLPRNNTSRMTTSTMASISTRCTVHTAFSINSLRS